MLLQPQNCDNLYQTALSKHTFRLCLGLPVLPPHFTVGAYLLFCNPNPNSLYPVSPTISYCKLESLALTSLLLNVKILFIPLSYTGIFSCLCNPDAKKSLQKSACLLHQHSANHSFLLTLVMTKILYENGSTAGVLWPPLLRVIVILSL